MTLTIVFITICTIIPLICSVIFTGFALFRKRQIFIWITLIFFAWFIYNGLFLINLISMMLGSSIFTGYIMRYLIDLCLFVRIYTYYKFSCSLVERRVPLREEIIWGTLTLIVLMSEFLDGINFNNVRFYVVFVISTIAVWSTLAFGLILILKNRTRFSSFDFKVLVVIFSASIFSYISDFAITVMASLKLTSANAGVSRFLLLLFSFIGICWTLREASRNNIDQNTKINEYEGTLSVESCIQAKTDVPESASKYSVELEMIKKKYLLTDRETVILGLLLEGKTNNEISGILWVSVGTVKSHVHNIFKKTERASRSQLFGLIDKSMR